MIMASFFFFLPGSGQYSDTAGCGLAKRYRMHCTLPSWCLPTLRLQDHRGNSWDSGSWRMFLLQCILCSRSWHKQLKSQKSTASDFSGSKKSFCLVCSPWPWPLHYVFHLKDKEVKNFGEGELSCLFQKLKPVCGLGSTGYATLPPTL